MADQEKKVILTREGYEKLEKELDYYISVRRNEISEQIAIARGFGDLSETPSTTRPRTSKAASRPRSWRWKTPCATAWWWRTTRSAPT